MRCNRCGRILKSKKSISLGYGASCYKKINVKPVYKSLDDFYKIEERVQAK